MPRKKKPRSRSRRPRPESAPAGGGRIPTTTGQWRRLYQLADRIYELEPWSEMVETEVFGFEDPEADEVCFVSVMGNSGQHMAVAIYPTIPAFQHFWRLAHGDIGDPFELLEVPQVQLSFEGRDLVELQDRAVLKQLNLSGRYRGDEGWPIFRSYRPGYFPWFIDAAEAERLACALEHLLALFPRLDLGLLHEYSIRDRFLVREKGTAAGETTWSDSVRALQPPPVEEKIPCPIPAGLVEAVAALPSRPGAFELGFFGLRASIQPTLKHRPQIPYNAMLADPDSGMILGVESLVVEADFDRMLGRIPGVVLGYLQQVGGKPERLLVDSARMVDLLAPTCRRVDIDLQFADMLPAIEEARESLDEHLS